MGRRRGRTKNCFKERARDILVIRSELASQLAPPACFIQLFVGAASPGGHRQTRTHDSLLSYLPPALVQLKQQQQVKSTRRIFTFLLCTGHLVLQLDSCAAKFRLTLPRGSELTSRLVSQLLERELFWKGRRKTTKKVIWLYVYHAAIADQAMPAIVFLRMVCGYQKAPHDLLQRRYHQYQLYQHIVWHIPVVCTSQAEVTTRIVKLFLLSSFF